MACGEARIDHPTGHDQHQEYARQPELSRRWTERNQKPTGEAPEAGESHRQPANRTNAYADEDRDRRCNGSEQHPDCFVAHRDELIGEGDVESPDAHHETRQQVPRDISPEERHEHADGVPDPGGKRNLRAVDLHERTQERAPARRHSRGDSGPFLRNGATRSIGTGKMIVEFCSVATSASACRNRSCSATGWVAICCAARTSFSAA